MRAQWRSTNLQSKQAVAALTFSDSNLFAGTIGDGIFKTSNHSSNWIAVNSGLMDIYITSFCHRGVNLLVGTANKGIFFSTDAGNNWTEYDKYFRNAWIGSLMIDGSNFFVGIFGGGGIFLSTDDGANWSRMNTGLPYIISTFFPAIMCFLDINTDIFAGTSSGVFLSTNNGTNWTAINTGLPNAYIYSLLGIDTNLFVGTYGGGIFLSTNMGTNWISRNDGLVNLNVQSLISNGKNIYAGTKGGIFLSTNRGANWIDVSAGLMDKNIYSLVVDSATIFAGTNSNGVWYRPLSEMITSIDEKKNEEPTGYFLSQNHPNPFSSSTSIQFQLQKPTHVTLKIFNALGVEIKTLINNEEYDVGSHSVEFALHTSQIDFRTGIYFYQIITPEFIQTKKMVVMR